MTIIDGHIHVGKWGKIFLNYESKIEEAVSVMKQSGIKGAVCMPADKESNESLLKEIEKINNFKFYFCAWVRPGKSFDKFISDKINKIKFFKIHPSIQRKKINDSYFSKYLRFASDNEIPVIVHCGRWLEMASYKFALDAAKKYKNLKLILAHMGGDQPSIYLSCAKEIKKQNYKNVFLGTESIREFYFLNQAVKSAGPDKIIFGSDYNLGLPEMYLPVIDSLKISSGEKDLILSKNILQLIK
jgi:uncharacterized protein